MKSSLNFAKTFPSGYISGQRYADGQTRTSNSPFALQETGGQSQFPLPI